MSNELKSIQDYTHAIEKKLATGDATEHTHREALGVVIESLASGISTTNEPKHIECGAPDFVIRKGVFLASKKGTRSVSVFWLVMANISQLALIYTRQPTLGQDMTLHWAHVFVDCE